MQTKRIRVNGRGNIVNLAALIGLGVFVAQMVEMDAVVSVLFACSVVCVAANYLAFISVRNRLRLDDIAIAMLTLISITLSDWQWNFDYYKPAIIVFFTILCIDLCVEIQSGETVRRRVSYLLVMVSVITNIQYYFNGLRYSYLGNTSLITLNFSNPNETAMWLLFIIILLCDSISVQKKYGLKMLLLVCMVSFLPILYRTNSRNCLIAMTLFFIGKLILHFFKIRKIPKWCLFLIALAPVFVYVGYMYIFIPNYDGFADWFAFLISEGKPLTARHEIWSDMKMDRLRDVLFGNYGVYHKEQLHNAIVTLYSRFGIFYVILVCRKLYRVMKRMPNAGMQLALGAVWLTGCFETSVFAGIAGMYILILLLPVFHQPEINHNKSVRT